MPDNITEETPASPELSTAVPATESVAEQAPETPKPKPHTSLAESALESSLSDVLPLSPVGGESEKNTPGKSEKKNGGRHGLRRGASAKKGKSGLAGSSVGVIEKPEEFKETLSGTGTKPREPRREFRPQEGVPAEKPSADGSVEENVAEKMEEIRQGAGWRIREKREKNFHHFQANAGAQRPKLIIEPAPIPVQEEEPSFWQKLKNRILAFFKIGKKKKKAHGKKRGGKFRGERPFGKKDFHGQRQGGKKNFNRNRNSGFRGGNGNRNRQQSKNSD